MIDNITVLIQQHVFIDSEIGEFDSGVVDSIKTYFVAHALEPDSLDQRAILLPEFDEEDIDALVFGIYGQLGEDDSVVAMEGSIGDPVLLTHGGGRIYHELSRLFIIQSSRLHLDRVVPEPQFGQRETPDR